ncbi:OadG family transporter subunit [Gallibacterium trehalosifermentans]|uniref:Probable oxaloacetate decarboxylase gamma chain n=1 Tax=Gallibacterium trehalosifermentans TaxID=516935 RepID=A0ABV6H247_9PAST
MTNFELLMEGVNLMFSGMGFVILFLIVLIYLVKLMSYIINKLSATKEIFIGQANISPNKDAHLYPIIIAAIHHHRRKQGKE